MKRRLVELTKRLWLVAILFALTLNASAQEVKTLLWEISGNGLEKSSYLYGTMHIICADDFRVSDNLKAAFAKTEKLALEVDLSDQNEMQAFQTGMVDMAGIDYKGMMSEEDYNKLDEIVKNKVGMGLAQMNIMKPFGILSIMYGEVLDCGEPESYEGTFMEMATEQKKEMAGLESAASQVAIFDDIPQEEQIKWITEMLHDDGKSKEELNVMLANYKAQDLDALYASMSESPEYADFEEELLDKRNKAWIPVIEKLTKEKSTFIAVGAMHLGGGNSVIKLLREAGFTVKAMEN